MVELVDDASEGLAQICPTSEREEAAAGFQGETSHLTAQIRHADGVEHELLAHRAHTDTLEGRGEIRHTPAVTAEDGLQEDFGSWDDPQDRTRRHRRSAPGSPFVRARMRANPSPHGALTRAVWGRRATKLFLQDARKAHGLSPVRCGTAAPLRPRTSRSGPVHGTQQVHEVQRSLADLPELRDHAVAHVEHQRNGDRDCRSRTQSVRSRPAVIANLEVGSRQIRAETAIAILNRRIHRHRANARPERGEAPARRWPSTPRRRRSAIVNASIRRVMTFGRFGKSSSSRRPILGP